MTTLLDPPSSPPADAPEPQPSRSGIFLGRTITSLLVIGPPIALAIAVPLLWGKAISLLDVILAVAFYLVSGFGVTVGYHRLFTHRSFRAARWLKITLAAAGSLAVEGSVVGWVANHRRHHVFSDKPGDPHSPHLHGTGVAAQLRGFAHAHVGWLFKVDTTSAERYAPELLDDADTRIVSRLFPLFAIVSLAAPFFLGWTITGALGGALTALLWAGLGAHDAAAPRDVERQLDLPHVRQATGEREGPQHELRAARDPLDGRVVAQLPPRAPRIGAPRRVAAPDRPVGRADPALRAHALCNPRALADGSATRALPVGLTHVCFAPEADALVGAIVVAIGVDALRHVREPKQIPARVAPAAVRVAPADRSVRVVGPAG